MDKLLSRLLMRLLKQEGQERWRQGKLCRLLPGWDPLCRLLLRRCR